MRIRLRKTVRRMMLLFVAVSTFGVGLSAFYFYAGAAAFLFKPPQPTPETTKILMTQPAPPPVSKRSFTFSTPEYQAGIAPQPICKDCVQDSVCGLCETLVGEYNNYSYGYAVTIPDELLALMPPLPAYDYGFIARLPSDTEATIEVKANYNDDTWYSLDAAVDANVEYLRASAQDVVLLKRNPARLGKLSAMRYVVQYKSTATGVRMIEDKTIAFRKDEVEKRFWTVFAVGLQSPALNYERNTGSLEKVLKRWREIEYESCGH
jgi:hypothetical protein